MKKCTFLLSIILFSFASIAQISINTDGSDADPSAMLDVKSENSGILIPRVPYANRPVDPANGLLIYQTDSIPGFYYYKGSEWINMKNLQTVEEQGYEVSLSQGGGSFMTGIKSYTQAGIDTLELYDGLTVHNANTNCINYYYLNNWFAACGTCLPKPSQAMAGDDQTIYDDTLSTTLTASTPEVGTGLWTVLSGDGGSFNYDTLPGAVFTGQPCTDYTLAWSISTSCDTTNDQVDVTFFATPTVAYAGNDTIVEGPPATIELSANTPLVGEGLWSIISGEGGSFDVATEPNAVFSGLVDVEYNLQWAIFTVCDTAFDDMNVKFPWQCGYPITDNRDSLTYGTVLMQGGWIGGQWCWMAENLAYLPSVNPSNQGSYIQPYYYVYDYQGTDVIAAKATSNYQTYGVLYNWPAAMAGHISDSSNNVPSGVQGVCPSGWHLPSHAEWVILEDWLGGWYVAGGKMKETDTTHWNPPNTGATNSSGFTGLPGGKRLFEGDFDNIRFSGSFWTTTKLNDGDAYVYVLLYDYKKLHNLNDFWEKGFSVRCVKGY